MFDRSGLYCSDLFDIQNDLIKFLSIILTYQRMTDDDLGQSSLVRVDDAGRCYIVLDDVATPSLGKLYLESQPIASSEALVGTGTTCYRARMADSDRWDYVLKFKWRWARDRPEDELLKLAKKTSVWGAVSVDYYQELESIANLRRGLRWGTHRRLGRIAIQNRNENVGVPCNTTGLADYTEETDNFFQNRILACMVTSPVGRPLHTFQSILELLRVFRDAIKCHRSLLTNAKILHQDISAGNIIILDGQDEEDPQGILIDLDSAIEVREEEPEAGPPPAGITGTRPFMAIGVLKRERHTYRHDLESFLYVFLWTIITNHGEDPPASSKLRQWSNGNWNELAVRKSLDMMDETKGFHTILSEFSPEFHSLKPLAESLRRVLFSNHEDGVNRICTGTDSSPEAVDKLYNGMVHAFDAAIASELRR
ncbi:hypothetical protein DV738_g1305, partial [Chaetothyriales sp. CBS 135597]